MSEIAATARRALDVYGGEAFWRQARTVRATVSTTGLAFVLKWQKPFRRVAVECDVRRPMTRIAPVNPDGTTGILRGGDVFLEKPPGHEIARRENARSFFPCGRRLFRWDSLDQTYFTGYALWNYLCFPALLLREDIRWQETGPSRLVAEFPAGIPTHCPVQEFLLDPSTGLLKQHNYTAEVIGGWARAANVVVEHADWNGIPYPSRRQVTPRTKDGTPSRGPLLIDLVIHEWAVEPGPSSSPYLF
jgi:hypothetical protein